LVWQVFWFSQNVFGDIGLKPVKKENLVVDITDTDKRVPFPTWQLGMIGVSALLGMMWLINVPATKITKGAFNLFNFQWFGLAGNHIAILFALALFLILVSYRLAQYSKTTREKLIAVLFFAFITIFFWAIFEQAPNSLTVFAKKYTNRVLTGNASAIFLVVNSLLTIVPLVIINWVMLKLFKKTFKTYPLASIILTSSFVIIWGIAIWMLAKDYYTAGYLLLSDATLSFLKIDKVTVPLTEIPATWFNTFNSLFIITLAPLFSRIWESKYNPSANVKYGIGMILLGLGMVAVAFGSNGIAPGAESASVSMIWLILVYLFHTMGELCISPVGLSYVSKLVPARMIAFMFGVWYLAVAIGMKSAGMFGESVGILMQPIIKKLMHEVK
jgi:proton-dependent oligopeptide transporter, POT family